MQGSGSAVYGNLIILEHADNYFTVYGFNAKNLVTIDSFVGQGERIELTHKAGDRSIFARGAVRAAQWVFHREAGGRQVLESDPL